MSNCSDFGAITRRCFGATTCVHGVVSSHAIPRINGMFIGADGVPEFDSVDAAYKSGYSGHARVRVSPRQKQAPGGSLGAFLQQVAVADEPAPPPAVWSDKPWRVVE